LRNSFVAVPVLLRKALPLKHEGELQMLLLINEQKNRVQVFHDYNGLYSHIEACEKQKISPRGNRHKAQCWVFSRHSHYRMATYQNVQAANANGAGNTQAKGWDILEIVSGNPTKPVFISLAHNLDIAPLQKNWCNQYCKAHGLNLIEIMDITDFRKLGALGR
jgi:hypothetical protein